MAPTIEKDYQNYLWGYEANWPEGYVCSDSRHRSE
jgi:hypothetical protein